MSLVRDVRHVQLDPTNVVVPGRLLVLPILDGERIVGRLDPAMDRQKEELRVNAAYAEPGAPKDRATPCRIADAVVEKEIS